MRKRTTRLFEATLRPRPERFRRGVACILLLLVTYNVTAELVHRHGQLLPPGVTTNAVVNRSQAAETAAKLAASGGVCLLCQFQQQLALGLRHAPPFALRPLALAATVNITHSNPLSISKAPPRGRAPPLSTLL